MKLTPGQYGLQLMCNGSCVFASYSTKAEAIADGRLHLHIYTRMDFGYDIRAWYDFLAEHKMYSMSNRCKPGDYPKSVLLALENPQWNEAVEVAESEKLFERLRDDRKKMIYATKAAERRWSGKPRNCPKCGHQFVSVQNLGRCTLCGFSFCASNPSHDPDWWRDYRE